MAHAANPWESRAQARVPGWKSILTAVRNALLRMAERADEDGSDLARENCTSNERCAVGDTYGEEVAAHVRGIIETGYFVEESGKRVFVPWYIRSQLINEMHKHQ